MDNREMFDKINALKSRIEVLKYQKSENERKKSSILEELKKVGINDIKELAPLIDNEQKNIEKLKQDFSISIARVESMTKELENKVAGISSNEATL